MGFVQRLWDILNSDITLFKKRKKEKNRTQQPHPRVGVTQLRDGVGGFEVDDDYIDTTVNTLAGLVASDFFNENRNMFMGADGNDGVPHGDPTSLDDNDGVLCEPQDNTTNTDVCADDSTGPDTQSDWQPTQGTSDYQPESTPWQQDTQTTQEYQPAWESSTSTDTTDYSSGYDSSPSVSFE
jgi:hypothetical protein